MWPANPWQAQAEAHLLQLHRSSAAFCVPPMPHSHSQGPEQNGHPMFFCGAGPPGASCPSTGGPAASTAPGGFGGCAGVMVALASSCCGAPCSMAMPVPPLPGPLGGYPAQQTSPQLQPQRPPQLQPQQLEWLDKDGLVRRIHELEGQVAFLEDTTVRQQDDLRQVEAKLLQAAQWQSQSLPGSSAEALQRQNDFLTVLVSRFERKTMALEEELAGLTLAQREALAASTPAASVAAETQTQAEFSQVLELEGQIALLEESLAGKESEIQALWEEQKLREASPSNKPRIPVELLDEVQGLREKNSFFSDLVARFEEKTMFLEKQVKAVSRAEQDARSQLKRHQEEQAIASEQLAAAREATECAHRQRAEQLGEEAESAAVALREAKKEHNRKNQELLRQVQLLEASCRRKDLEAKTRLEEVSSEDSQELREQKELNAQLVEKLSRERVVHVETRRFQAALSSENEVLTARADRLSDQLYELSELNDMLEEQVKAASRPDAK